MKERKKEDDGKPRSANDSMRINPFANQSDHVELEQLSKCSRFQLKPEKGSGVFNGVYHPTDLLYISSFFRAKSLSYRWFLRFLCTNSHYEDDFREE